MEEGKNTCSSYDSEYERVLIDIYHDVGSTVRISIIYCALYVKRPSHLSLTYQVKINPQPSCPSVSSVAHTRLPPFPEAVRGRNVRDPGTNPMHPIPGSRPDR